ncbi:MAG: CvpA family protein [Steroidobacteraceae bacterium]
MNGADYLMLGVLLASMLLGMLRGFVREAVGLLAWLGGLWFAWRYAPLLEPYLGGMVGEPPVSTWTARIAIVLVVLLLGWLVAGILGYFLRHSALSVMVDRLLGLVFGTLRGAVVVAVIVMFGQFVEMDRVDWWKRSSLMPYAGEFASWIQSFAETGLKVLADQQPSQSEA